MPIVLKSQHVTNMYTPIELVTTNINVLGWHGGGGGITDHGQLHGLGDNDHDQYLLSSRSTQFIPIGNSVSYQYLSNSNLSLGTGASASFMQTNNSSTYVFAKSNSILFALTNHTHTGLDGAASDHSHGSVYTVGTAGSDLNVISNSSGITIGVPSYLTTAYGGAIQGSGTYSQNTGTIQFSNANGVSFDLGTDGIMRASIPAVGGAQTGISSIVAAGGTITEGQLSFANSNGVEFGMNGSTITANYTVPGVTVFSNSNNVEFGLNGSTVTALAQFNQTTQTQNLHNVSLSGNTAGIMTQISSGTMTLIGGNNITLSQSGNKVTIIGPTTLPGGHNITFAGNTSGILTEVSTGTLSIAGGSNITLSQNGNAVTIIGAAQGGVQTGVSGIGASNTTYSSGTIIMSAQNNITIGTFATSDSQYVRFSVGNYLLTAAQSNHTHGSNVSTVSISTGTNIVASSASNGLTISYPAYLTTILNTMAGTSFSTLSTSNTGADALIVGSLNSNGLTLGIPKYITTALPVAASANYAGTGTTMTGASATLNTAGLQLNVPQGSLHFSDGSGIVWGVSTSGLSSTITGSVTVVGGGAGSWTTTTQSGNNIDISTATNINTLYYPVFSTMVGGTGGAAIKGSGTYYQNSGTVVFQTGNGITFGLSNNGTMTASHNAYSTSSQLTATFAQSSSLQSSVMTLTYMPLSYQSCFSTSNLANTFINTSQTGSVYFTSGSGNITWNSSSTGRSTYIWGSAPSAGAGGVAIKASGTNVVTNGTLNFSNSNGAVFGINGSTLTMNYTVPSGSVQFVDNGAHSFSSSVGTGTASIITYIWLG